MSSTSSPKTSMVDVKLVLTHFYFHSSAIFITLRPNRDTQYKFCKNWFFHCFLLPSVYIPFWNSPQSCLKNRRKCIYCALSAALPQQWIRWPPFLLHDFNKNSASFQWEKIDLNLLFSFFLAFVQNRVDWAVTGRLARVQFKFTFRGKVRTTTLNNNNKQYI